MNQSTKNGDNWWIHFTKSHFSLQRYRYTQRCLTYRCYPWVKDIVSSPEEGQAIRKSSFSKGAVLRQHRAAWGMVGSLGLAGMWHWGYGQWARGVGRGCRSQRTFSSRNDSVILRSRAAAGGAGPRVLRWRGPGLWP